MTLYLRKSLPFVCFGVPLCYIPPYGYSTIERTYSPPLFSIPYLTLSEKLPKTAELKEKRRQLAARKRELYNEYCSVQEKTRQVVSVKANIDHLLSVTDGQRKKEQERHRTVTQTNYFWHGVHGKIAGLCGEMRRDGAGGFWSILFQSSIAKPIPTSPKAASWGASPTSVATLVLLAAAVNNHFSYKALSIYRELCRCCRTGACRYIKVNEPSSPFVLQTD